MGRFLTRLPRLLLAQLRMRRSTTGGGCRRDLEKFPSPDGIFTCFALCLQGGGVHVAGGGSTLTISSCNITRNTAQAVRAHARNFPSEFLLTCQIRLPPFNWDQSFVLPANICTCHPRLQNPVAPMADSHCVRCLQDGGGGVAVSGGTVAISSCTISWNTVDWVNQRVSAAETFQCSHRPDGKIAYLLATTLACTYRPHGRLTCCLLFAGRRCCCLFWHGHDNVFLDLHERRGHPSQWWHSGYLIVHILGVCRL
jgi:hypothetical protein